MQKQRLATCPPKTKNKPKKNLVKNVFPPLYKVLSHIDIQKKNWGKRKKKRKKKKDRNDSSCILSFPRQLASKEINLWR